MRAAKAELIEIYIYMNGYIGIGKRTTVRTEW